MVELRLLNAMTPPRYVRERTDFRLSAMDQLPFRAERIPIGDAPTTNCRAQPRISLKLNGYRSRAAERSMDTAGALLFLLCREIERIALGAAHFRSFLRLSLRHVAGIDRDDAGSLLVRRHHHLVGVTFVHPEYGLEYLHDELARRVVIVEQDDLPQRRTLSLWLDLCARLLERLLAHRDTRLQCTLMKDPVRTIAVVRRWIEPGSAARRLTLSLGRYFFFSGSTVVFEEPSGAGCMPGGV